MKDADINTNLIDIINKDDCFLNIIGLFSHVRKDGLKVQVSRLRKFHKAMVLYDF